MNHFIELLEEKNFILNFSASSKEEVIHKLVSHAIGTNSISSEHKDEIITALLNREKTMSTGIGSGVAIPHCSVNVVEKLEVVCAISKEGILFDAIDHLPVHIFILLIVPKSKFQEHIKTLALIAKTLNDKEIREKIINISSFENLKKIFAEVN